MTVQRSRRDQPPPTRWDDWDQPVLEAEEPSPRGVPAFVTVLLVVLAVTVLCGAGFLLVRLLLPRAPEVLPGPGTYTPAPALTGAMRDQTPSPGVPGQAEIGIEPSGGNINTLVTVSGRGWWPGEAVFIFLRSPEEANEHGFTYAAAVADNAGRITTAFTFPNEMRWMEQPWAEVIARGSRSNLQAASRFELLIPTATNTVPIPTAPPYTPDTATPLQPTRTPAPTSSSTPTGTPTQPVITDWRGEYYANATLAGQPLVVRNDVNIDFVWGPGSPASTLPVDGFSVRWTRTRQFREGTWRFSATADDGVRVYVDNQLIIDEWHDSGSTTYTADVHLARGQHGVRVEYYENIGAAVMQFGWARLDGPTATPTATATSPGPTVTPTDVAISDWRGEYYANPSLAGSPVLVRNDFYVKFSWGFGSPADGIPSDGFSARWSRVRRFRDELYRFTVTVDDGVRVYLDGQAIINEWHDSSTVTYSVEVPMSAGDHVLVIEYYDNIGNAEIEFGYDRVK